MSFKIAYHSLVWVIALAGFLMCLGNECNIALSSGIALMTGAGGTLLGVVVNRVAQIDQGRW